MSQKAAETEQLRRLFRFFSATQGRGRSPVYELLSEAAVDDDDLLDLLLSARPFSSDVPACSSRR